VFIWYSAAAWSLLRVYIDRMKAMSSTHSATCGNNSETSIPHCPCFLNFHGDGMSPPGPLRDHHVALAGHCLALAAEQFRLGVEGVHVADAAVTEDRDHGPRLRVEMGRFRRHRIEPRGAGGHIQKRKAGDATAEAMQRFPS
jgi:hypothetical protein